MASDTPMNSRVLMPSAPRMAIGTLRSGRRVSWAAVATVSKPRKANSTIPAAFNTPPTP